MVASPPSTPVTIVTGFLGAGKTTLINRLLRDQRFADTAVIVNEFGSVGLDHLLVEGGRDRVILLDSGCLCCEMAGSLRETLADLYQRRATAAVPPFTRVVIETSGLAEPGPIVETLLRDPLLEGRYSAGSVVCVIDALDAPAMLAAHAEAREQAAFADLFVLAKGEPAGPGASRAARDAVIAINAHAPWRDSDERDFDPEALLDATPVPWEERGMEHVHVHGTDVAAHALAFKAEASSSSIIAWTDHLRARWGTDLLRVKALIPRKGLTGPALVQGVRDRFAVSSLAAWPGEATHPRIVVIGRNLDRRSLEEGLAWLGVVPGLAGDAGLPPCTEDACASTR